MLNSTAPDVRASPLLQLHQELGAVDLEAALTLGRPAHFGSAAEEYRELQSGCGLIDTSDRSTLELSGADRRRFLNGMVTGDVSSLEAGEGLYCFFTSPRGRVLSDAVVIATSDPTEKLVLLLPPGMALEIKAHLSQFVVADRVEITVAEDFVCLRLLGPTSVASLGERASGGELPTATWHSRVMTIGDIEVLVTAEDLGDLPGFNLLVDRSQAEALSRNLLQSDVGHPHHRIRLCGSAALETTRIETGTLQFGKDFSVENFPKETGIDSAVSYTKGCYLGQEVVARIHYRGQVNHVARGLLFEGEASAEGKAVQSGGRDIGSLSSATQSPRLDRGIGVSILLRTCAEPGSRVDLADGKTAEVVELPFELPAPGVY